MIFAAAMVDLPMSRVLPQENALVGVNDVDIKVTNEPRKKPVLLFIIMVYCDPYIFG